MKTYKAIIAFVGTAFIVSAAHSQIGLNLGSTTQAAVSATASTNAVSHTSNTAVNATKNTVKTTSAATKEVKSATRKATEKTINTTDQIKTEASKNSNINLRSDVALTAVLLV